MSVPPLLAADVGASRLEICVADITTLDVDAIVNAANGRCSAAAASTAPSIAPPDPSSWPNARRWAAATPVPPRSPAATGSRPGTSFTRSARSGAAVTRARRHCSPLLSHRAFARGRKSPRLDRLSRDLDRHLPVPPERAARIAVGTVAAELAGARACSGVVFLAASLRTRPRTTATHSRRWA